MHVYFFQFSPICRPWQVRTGAARTPVPPLATPLVNLTGSNAFRTLARAVVKAPKSTHITTILKSLHWLKVNELIYMYKLLSLIIPTKFLQELNLAILTTLSLINPLAVPAPHLLSPFLAR